MYICAGSGFVNVEDDLGEVFTVNCPGCDSCVENPDREDQDDDEEYEFYEEQRRLAYAEEIALEKEEANEPEYVPLGEYTDKMFD